ncbi:hypothetical protein ACROYT_G019394 [Oculina patagonica]
MLDLLIYFRSIKYGMAGSLKYNTDRKIIYLNALGTDAEAVKLPKNMKQIIRAALISTLLASGFRRIPTNRTDIDYDKFLPCPVGTFSNTSSKGRQGCTKCPPGGFYTDTFGYVAESCMKCPNGSFVAYDKAPGTRPQDCKACPEGTETDFFAGHRACKCLDGFHRTHLFKKCHKCGHGLECKNDYISLKSGYWWRWRSEKHIDEYRDYVSNLLASPPALDSFSVQYPYPIPTPYKCPVEGSCKGGLTSQCEIGYKGPLCGVCSSGYYKQLQTCQICQSKMLIVGQLSIITAILLIIVAILVWTTKRKTKEDQAFSMIDMFLSKLKIVIGFYQVTYGLLEAFSYIKWPDSLEAIGKYSGILQMNILQIAPIHCLFPGLHVDAFGNLLVTMTINAAVISFCGVAYGVRKVIIMRSSVLQDEEKSRKISQTKELVYRNLFFFLYVTYLSTCSKTAAVLPLACRKLCRDEKEELCEVYMKADYSVQCQGETYNQLLIAAYISIVYVVVLPAASFIALWKQRRVIYGTSGSKLSQEPDSDMEITMGLRFLFENYKPISWYWELVELSRKVILTSGLILVGQESRSYIGLAWVMAGMYGMLFSWVKPIQDVTENRLMTASLAVTVVNLGVGAVSRIPTENVSSSGYQYVDAVLFKALVLGANTMVIGLLIVQYALHLYHYFKEWRKNPQWSFSCCLALLLPFSGLQGEISGLVGTNFLDNQLQTGQIERPTFQAAVKDSGAIDVTLGEGHQPHNSTIVVQGANCRSVDTNDTKCHQGTQTEISALWRQMSPLEPEIVELFKDKVLVTKD